MLRVNPALRVVAQGWLIDAVEALVREAVILGARRIEVAHSQYYGWTLKNRAALRRSGRRSPKYRTVSSRNGPLTGRGAKRVPGRVRGGGHRRTCSPTECALTHIFQRHCDQV